MTAPDTAIEETRIPDTVPSQQGDESTATDTTTAPQDSTPANPAEPSTATNPSQGTKRSRPQSDNGDAERTTVVLGEDGKPLSKNQLKKIRRQEAWKAGAESRKIKRKEKRHEKQARKRTELEEKLDAARAAGLDPEEVKKELSKGARADKRHCPVPVAFILDCDFERYMLDNEVISLSSQVVRSYSMNKMAKYNAHLFVSSFGGKMRERFENVLAGNHKKWRHAQLIEGDFVEAARLAGEVMRGEKGGEVIDVLKPVEKEEGGKEAENGAQPEPETEEEGVDRSIVYLTSDSPYTLETLEPNTSYVIGGIVDRNREKGLCYKKAVERKVRTAKLPIGEYMAMQSRFVLTTNQVVEIMAKWLECGDWGEAFLHVIPQRKGGVLKGSVAGSDADHEDGQAMEEAREAEDRAAEDGEDGEGKAEGEQASADRKGVKETADEQALQQEKPPQVTAAEAQS
ncbi:guanine-1-methyltransferase-domain-containing protein [Coniochaeta sp. 2T2.1]|nr:guanine-1-methyltransferase-domain-containing protein [Coniochaeta sp. 2T2.1]